VNRLDGKVAFLSGAARGIGGATARLMVQAGAKVAIGDILDETGRKLAQEIGALYIHLDVTSETSWAEALDATVKAYGKLDVLVNNAGIFNGKGVEEASLDDWHRLVAVNLTGVVLGTRAALPHLKKTKGCIVNLASIAGRGLSFNSSSAYAAAKGGIIAFTRKLAHELGPDGINVNAIAPSVTLTERIRPHWEKRSQAAQAEEIERTPLRRVAEAVDQANVICFLASSDADFVTGLTIDVTGGV